MTIALLANAVEMSITSVASAGLGDVTLNAAVGDNNTFAQAGYLDGPGVSYFAEEPNGDYESGIGHLTTTQTILVRDQVLEKSVGGTVTQLPATKLTITTNGIISVRPNALMQSAVMPTFRRSTGHYQIPDNIISIGTITITPIADRMCFTGVDFWNPRLIAQFGIDVSTADAVAANTRCGLYSANADGSPGDLIIDTGNIDLTSTGVQMISAASWATGGTSTLLIPAGFYWLAFVTDSTIARFHSSSNTFADVVGSGSWADPFNIGRRWGYGLFDDGITGALPATPVVDGTGRMFAIPVSKPV